jgi:N-acetylmuramoyl-L-alanine amidase
VIRLAGLENRDSGYSLADYRQLLEQVYIDARRDESRRLATAVNTALFRSLSPVNPALENRGVKMAPFVVLIGTQMPAILVEVSCVSNEDEVKLLTSPEYRDAITRGLLRGIRSYASTLERSDKRGL